ncbi:YncE family protein [Pendulispora albinea]|uniref:Uncharacterized protein n=1 Tax=Pendulispora albinea TaxID=2741071 RepID=A0ABZ2M522_9BACT
MRRISILGSAILSSALTLVPFAVTSCSDDGKPNPPRGDAGGDGATKADSAATGDSATTADSGHDAGPGCAFPAGNDAGRAGHALFVGSDFVTSELSVVSLESKTVAGRLPIDNGDSVAAASGGFGFVLERGLGRVKVLDPAQPWTVRSTVDINDTPDAGAYVSNPHALVVTTCTKAYVARYASNGVTILDAASGTVIGNVDLSPFLHPDDKDGTPPPGKPQLRLVDVTDALYDAAAKRAYFLLQRIDQFDYDPTYNLGRCKAWPAQLVAVDVTNDTLVDLNGDLPGKALDLLGDNPQSLTADVVSGRILIPSTGCYIPPTGGDPVQRRGRGIEAVSIAAKATAWLYHASDSSRLDGMVWADATHAFVRQDGQWSAWNPTQTTLGGVVSNFPIAPFSDGAGHILGLSDKHADGGPASAISVVSWDVATSQISTIVERPFQGVEPDLFYGVTSAHLR